MSNLPVLIGNFISLPNRGQFLEHLLHIESSFIEDLPLLFLLCSLEFFLDSTCIPLPAHRSRRCANVPPALRSIVCNAFLSRFCSQFLGWLLLLSRWDHTLVWSFVCLLRLEMLQMKTRWVQTGCPAYSSIKQWVNVSATYHRCLFELTFRRCWTMSPCEGLQAHQLAHWVSALDDSA